MTARALLLTPNLHQMQTLVILSERHTVAFRTNRVVLHTFRYARPDPALQESVRLQIRRREDIVQAGLRLERELDINLSAPQDLIELQ